MPKFLHHAVLVAEYPADEQFHPVRHNGHLTLPESQNQLKLFLLISMDTIHILIIHFPLIPLERMSIPPQPPGADKFHRIE
jgi:hypothetical protein